MEAKWSFSANSSFGGIISEIKGVGQKTSQTCDVYPVITSAEG
jgi:hypothetical protein